MKLTKADKETILKWGYRENELEQVQVAANVAVYELYSPHVQGKKIGVKKAIEILGRKEWLSGICRAAFHWTAGRISLDEKCEVGIDCSSMFRQ